MSFRIQIPKCMYRPTLYIINYTQHSVKIQRQILKTFGGVHGFTG